MRVLAFEYACAEGRGAEPYLAEGKAMLSALLHDLSRAGVDTTTLLHPSLPADGFPANHVIRSTDLFTGLARTMEPHDAVWIIAPETNGCLLQLTRLAESLKKKVAGAGSAAVEICGDKLKTYQTLGGLLPMPFTVPFNGSSEHFPCVIKPVDGAGCEKTFLAHGPEELGAFSRPEGRTVVQPFIEGEPMSAAFVTAGKETLLLGVARQRIGYHGKIKFSGVEGPVNYINAAALEVIADVIMANVPGLNGYWGIDFMDTPGGPVLIEVNPRLTSSYPLYRAKTPFNIAKYVLDAL